MDRSVQITDGMDVVTTDGHSLGRVKELSDDQGYFQCDCRFAPDYYIPMSAIDHTEDGQVLLRVSKAQAANMGWEVRPSSDRGA